MPEACIPTASLSARLEGNNVPRSRCTHLFPPRKSRVIPPLISVPPSRSCITVHMLPRALRHPVVTIDSPDCKVRAVPIEISCIRIGRRRAHTFVWIVITHSGRNYPCSAPLCLLFLLVAAEPRGKKRKHNGYHDNYGDDGYHENKQRRHFNSNYRTNPCDQLRHRSGRRSSCPVDGFRGNLAINLGNLLFGRFDRVLESSLSNARRKSCCILDLVRCNTGDSRCNLDRFFYSTLPDTITTARNSRRSKCCIDRFLLDDTATSISH